jgi:hypothetical protein
MPSYINNFNLDLQKEILNEISLLNTEEEVVNIYNNILNIVELEEDLKRQVESINAFKQLDLNAFQSLKEYIDFMFLKLSVYKETLIKDSRKFNTYKNSQEINIDGKFKKIKQKLSFLKSFQENVKFSFAESFNNRTQIDGRETNSLNIDSTAGVCTLPIKGNEEINVFNVTILSSSNGIPGNLITGKNRLATNILNKNENSFFEYNKLHKGPLNLVLEFHLKEQSIINCLSLKQRSKMSAANLIIKEIIYKDSEGTAIRLNKLINKNHQNLQCESFSLEEELKIIHLPAKAIKIEVHLKSDEFITLNNKKTFNISLNNINFERIEYSSKGEISFQERKIENNDAYSAKSKLSCHPSISDKSFNATTRVNFGGGENFDISNNILILDEEKQSAALKLSLERTNELKSLKVINDNFNYAKSDFKQKRFDRHTVPNYINVDYKEKGLEVYQPKILRRTNDRREAVTLHLAKTENEVVNFPINIHEYNIKHEDIIIYAGNKKLDQVEPGNDLVENSFKVDSGGDFFTIKIPVTNNSIPIKMKLLPIRVPIIKKPEGVFIEINDFFDRDLDTVKIKNLNTSAIQNATEKHKIDTRFLNLRNRYIIGNSFKCISDIEGLDPETGEVVTHAAGINSSRFNLNTTNGTLEFVGDEVLNKDISLTYDYYEASIIEDKKLWIYEDTVKGIFIDKNDIKFTPVTQTLDEERESDPLYEQEKNQTSDQENKQRFFLKYGGIIEDTFEFTTDPFENNRIVEIRPFLDGKTEFLGLKNIQDIVPAIEANINGLVEFTLSKIPYIPEDGSGLESIHSIRIFKNGKEVPRDFSINNRICSLTIPEETSDGYVLHYSYQDDKYADFVKYSVNYKDGVLYISQEMPNASNQEIKFEIGGIGIEYDICRALPSWELEDSMIKFNPENTLLHNNKIKVSWYKNLDSFDIEDMEKYYSPIIYKLQMDMT